jgi:hypothetical protein
VVDTFAIHGCGGEARMTAREVWVRWHIRLVISASRSSIFFTTLAVPAFRGHVAQAIDLRLQSP